MVLLFTQSFIIITSHTFLGWVYGRRHIITALSKYTQRPLKKRNAYSPFLYKSWQQSNLLQSLFTSAVIVHTVNVYKLTHGLNLSEDQIPQPHTRSRDYNPETVCWWQNVTITRDKTRDTDWRRLPPIAAERSFIRNGKNSTIYRPYYCAALYFM